MKRNLVVLASAALLMAGISPALAQDGYRRDNPPARYLDDEGNGHRVQERDRHARDRQERREQFGQRDVISLLESRGYRVREVRLERGQYLVRASRRGERLLVIVSRRGEILETRRMTTDRF
ncbi:MULTISPECIES: hypothetical protein [Agrobacterium]|uniref:PepSY domain-containing protein n=2 Tax=Agrobacterium TaxID=357 RepID=A0A4D7YK35_AGRTU|nr:hypothetical protein [Agrobacterium tumefaciens]KJF71730.1 hypothetical protein RP75_19630 [Agrobacterium arsenijevicii]QCL96735.1 hypothetical protein CFBP7129_21420 [Agrobacterium tumefaciens]